MEWTEWAVMLTSLTTVGYSKYKHSYQNLIPRSEILQNPRPHNGSNINIQQTHDYHTRFKNRNNALNTIAGSTKKIL